MNAPACCDARRLPTGENKADLGPLHNPSIMAAVGGLLHTVMGAREHTDTWMELAEYLLRLVHAAGGDGQGNVQQKYLYQ